MRTTSWVPITDLENIPDREGRSVRWAGMNVAIFNLGERVVAVENRCPHSGGPLADGIVSSVNDKITVTCPLHNWRICLDTGEVAKPSGLAACVRTFPVRLVDGVIQVALPAEEEFKEAVA